MTAPIDESTAWDLVRAVRRSLGRDPFPARVHNNPRPEVWLQVQTAGQWKTSTSVTTDARNVLDLYLPLQTRHQFVIGQIGQSLDGRIATETGHSHYITGPADIRRLHRLRALVDAVIVGANTVVSDNPRLTVREVEGDNPVRVVLDPDGRVETTRHVFSDGAARTLAVRRAPIGQTTISTKGNVLHIPVSNLDDSSVFNPKTVIQALASLGYRRVLVEGGGTTVSRFLQSGTLDRLHITVAPLLIGSGQPAITLDPISSLDQALHPRCRRFHLGQDVLFDLDLREHREPTLARAQ